jgi:cell division septum initiation protein DivIVA
MTETSEETSDAAAVQAYIEALEGRLEAAVVENIGLRDEVKALQRKIDAAEIAVKKVIEGLVSHG